MVKRSQKKESASSSSSTGTSDPSHVTPEEESTSREERDSTEVSSGSQALTRSASRLSRQKNGTSAGGMPLTSHENLNGKSDDDNDEEQEGGIHEVDQNEPHLEEGEEAEVEGQQSPAETSPHSAAEAAAAASPASSLGSSTDLETREISTLVASYRALKSQLKNMKRENDQKISLLEANLSEKACLVSELEAKLGTQSHHHGNLLESDLVKLRRRLGEQNNNLNRHHSSGDEESADQDGSLTQEGKLELYLLSKAKRLEAENEMLRNMALLGQSAMGVPLPASHMTNQMAAHVTSSGSENPLQDVKSFSSLLGQELVSQFYKRPLSSAAENDDDMDDNDSDRSESPDALAAARGRSPAHSTSTGTGGGASGTRGATSPPSSAPSPSAAPALQSLAERLRANVERHMNDNLNTLNISRCVREYLSVHNIGQRLFAKYVLGLSQGTVSELLSKPKPWDKLTEKGRDSYRKMHAWATDDTCIGLLKSLVPRKGKDMTPLKSSDDPAAEERIAAILSEAQRAMITPPRGPHAHPHSAAHGHHPHHHPISHHHHGGHSHLPLSFPHAAHMGSLGLVNGGVKSLSGGEPLGHGGQDSKSASDALRFLRSQGISQSSHMTSPPLGGGANDLSPENLSQEIVARIYQEELTKLLTSASVQAAEAQQQQQAAVQAQQQQQQLRLNQNGGGSASQEDVHKALFIYHQELARLTQMASNPAGLNQAQHPEVFARLAAAAGILTAQAQAQSGAAIPGQGHLPNGLNFDLSSPTGSGRPVFPTSLDGNNKERSAFAGLKPEVKLEHKSGSTNNNVNSANNGSASDDPLARMQSITNSLLSQASVNPLSPGSTGGGAGRSTKAALPPITQAQFDAYNNMNTEDIVKRVKEQLSQYSISQRLFGESVLGLSQGSVSDLLARPKPWHMLTQKGREPFIRMKMFLDDEQAVHKLVASQYKIAPEKLMRTGGGFTPGPTGPHGAALGLGPGGPLGGLLPVSNSMINSPFAFVGRAGGNMARSGSPLKHQSSGPTTDRSGPVATSVPPKTHTPLSTTSSSRDDPRDSSERGGGGGSGRSAAFSPSSVKSVGGSSTPDHVMSAINLNLSSASHSGPSGPHPPPPLFPRNIPPNLSALMGSLSAGLPPTSTSASSLASSSIGPSLPVAGSNIITAKLSSSPTGNTFANLSRPSAPYPAPSVYEMAALTNDLDTQIVTTRVKEVLLANNIGQKLFGEVVLGLSQGSVSELLSKPKPWHMLSIKGREPFIRMQLWLNDTHNIDRLQAIKNDRREANKRRRTDDSSPTHSLSHTFGQSHGSGSGVVSGGGGMEHSRASSDGMRMASHGGPIAHLMGTSSGGGESSSEAKKARLLFTDEQKEALRLAFAMDSYPSTVTMEFLAEELGLSVRTITNWFHNHRMRRKQLAAQNQNGGSGSNNNNGNASNDENSNSFSSSTIGRDGVSFDAMQFRILLAQRLGHMNTLTSSSSMGGGHNTATIAAIFGRHHHASSNNEHLGNRAQSRSASPSLCSDDDDDDGTLDLSSTCKPTSGNIGANAYSSANHHETYDSDCESSAALQQQLVRGQSASESAVTSTAKLVGSSRRKPLVVSSTTSRRKAAKPQYRAPLDEGDDDDEVVGEADDEDDLRSFSPDADNSIHGRANEESGSEAENESAKRSLTATLDHDLD